MSEFFLTPHRKAFLAGLYSRKPPDLVARFIDLCEREIVAWLKSDPAGIEIRSHDAIEQLAEVRAKAWALVHALQSLDSGVSFLLFSRYLTASERGVGTQAVRKIERNWRDAASGLAEWAADCHDWQDGPITRRVVQDLCDQLTRVHLETFLDLPSANKESGVFFKFCKELANDISPYLPDYCELTRDSKWISRRMVESSRARFSPHASPLE